MNLFTVAAIQMLSGITLEKNLSRAQALIDQAVAKGAQLVLLPEYFCLMGSNELDKVKIAEPLGNGPIQTMLANAAKKNKIWLIGGTVPIATENDTQEVSCTTIVSESKTSPTQKRVDADEHSEYCTTEDLERLAGSTSVSKVRNTSVVYNPDGDLVQHYDKIHLFSYQGKSENFDEAHTIVAGQKIATCFINTPLDVLHIGLSVCYDLRFPELYRHMGKPNPLDLIVVPAAFTYATGQAHWEVLLRARAIENQCYVLAASQGGIHENGRQTWGHSMLIDPWGKILAQLENGEGIVSGNIDRKHIDTIRKNLPALTHQQDLRKMLLSKRSNADRTK